MNLLPTLIPQKCLLPVTVQTDKMNFFLALFTFIYCQSLYLMGGLQTSHISGFSSQWKTPKEPAAASLFQPTVYRKKTHQTLFKAKKSTAKFSHYLCFFLHFLFFYSVDIFFCTIVSIW